MRELGTYPFPPQGRGSLLAFADHRKDKVIEAFRKPSTVYFGGGTPSVLPIPLLNRLVEGIEEIVDTSEVEEWTMECNPDDVTPELAAWIGSSPINRVSMGVQTFDENRLKWLHRRHDVSEVVRAVELLRDNGIENISLDLMFGFPEKVDGKVVCDDPLGSWAKDIDSVLALKPQHISAYSLMYEEGTMLYRMLEQDRVEEISEEMSLAMYEMLIDRLEKAGYMQYEISNFALPGYESKHNSSYWQQVPYLGIGAGAHSYDLERRWWNVCDVKKYIKDSIIEEIELLDERTKYNDLITTALRTRRGINMADVNDEYRDYLMRMAQPNITNGYLVLEDNHLHLTRKGLFVSDSVMSDLIFV